MGIEVEPRLKRTAWVPLEKEKGVTSRRERR